MELIEKLKWKSQWALLKGRSWQYRESSKFTHSDNVIIAGSGRSGTTWLAEVLSSRPEYVLVNEPLKNHNSKRVQKIGFTGWGQYIPEDADWPEATRFFHDLFTGQELNPNYFTNGLPNYHTELFVHKFIRIPFLLPWLCENFNTRKPIYIIRNPYAVISSQLRHVGFGKNKDFRTGIHDKLPQFQHFNSFYAEWGQYFENLENYTQKLALHWILENKYVLNHPYCGNKWRVISYEEFILDPVDTLEVIKSETEINIDQIDQAILNKGSYAKIDSIPESPIDQLLKWRNHLSQEQIEDINNLLEEHDFDIYSPHTGCVRSKEFNIRGWNSDSARTN